MVLVRSLVRLWVAMGLLLALSLLALGDTAGADAQIRGPHSQADVILAAPCSDAATALPGGSGALTPALGQEVDDEGPDILFLALITTAAVLGAAVVGFLLYLLRLRLGFWLHRPPPADGGPGGEEH